MIIRWALCCALTLAISIPAFAAEKPPAKKAVKPAAKVTAKAGAKFAAKGSAKPPVKASAKPTATARKASARPVSKAPARIAAKQATDNIVRTSLKPAQPPSHTPTPATLAPLRGKTEILTCRDGTEDRHARIAVVLVGGRTDSFAYYSKWKPRTCSIYLQRNREPHSKWAEKGNVTSVNVEHGLFLIEHNKGEYRFVFRDVDRERYCGMEGTINGSLILRKGSERCEVAGIMEEGVPLGQAVAHMEQAAAVAAAPAPVQEAAPVPPKQVAQQAQRRTVSPWPTASVGISD